jgi:drug/metabolite transporter (DMT)-like permease
MSQLFYSVLTSAFESTKHGISKATLTKYATSTTVMNMIFIKHIVKTFFYIIVILLLKNESLSRSFNELGVMMKDTVNLKLNTNMVIFIGIAIAGLMEVVYSFPYYIGIEKYSLGTFVIMITIFTVIFNTTIGRLFFNETITVKKIIGIILSVTGIGLITTG